MLRNGNRKLVGELREDFFGMRVMRNGAAQRKGAAILDAAVQLASHLSSLLAIVGLRIHTHGPIRATMSRRKESKRASANGHQQQVEFGMLLGR